MSRLKEVKTKLILLYFLFVAAATYLLMPTSIGGAYQASIVPNIYLPDVGIDSHIGVNPRSIIAYVALMRILSIVCDADILAIIRMTGFFSVFAILCSYILILRILPGDKHVKILIAYTYPIVLLGLNTSILRGYVFSLTIPLCFTILFFLFGKQKNCNYIPLFLVALISWVALGFFWHSMHVMTYIIIITYLILFNLTNIRENNQVGINWNLPILVTVIFIATWIYLRYVVIAFTLNKLHIDFALSSIFGKGSFAGDYSFISALPIEYIDGIRY